MSFFRSLIVQNVFTYLLYKGLKIINYEDKYLTKQYSTAWNDQMQWQNSLIQAIFGQKAVVDLTKYTLTSEQQQQKLMTNLGLFLVVAAFSIQYRALVPRFVALMGFFFFCISYGASFTQYTTADYIEKYQYLALSALFAILTYTEQRVYPESQVLQILENQKQEFLSSLESKYASKKNKKNKNQQEQQENSNQNEQTKTYVQSKIQQEQQQQDEEEEEEEEVQKQEQVKNSKKVQPTKNSDDEDEALAEERRKFKVDEDGFSIVPKANAKKTYAQKKAEIVNKNMYNY